MAKTRRTRAEAAEEKQRYASLATNGGAINLCVEDDGAFVILDGMPHVEIPGANIAEALRALATFIEEATCEPS